MYQQNHLCIFYLIFTFGNRSSSTVLAKSSAMPLNTWNCFEYLGALVNVIIRFDLCTEIAKRTWLIFPGPLYPQRNHCFARSASKSGFLTDVLPETPAAICNGKDVFLISRRRLEVIVF